MFSSARDRPEGSSRCSNERDRRLYGMFGDDERLIGIELAENFQAHLLRIDEAVLLGRVELMRAKDLPAFASQGVREFVLHFRLFRPAFLVGGEPQIAIGYQISVEGFERRLILHDWKDLETPVNELSD